MRQVTNGWRILQNVSRSESACRRGWQGRQCEAHRNCKTELESWAGGVGGMVEGRNFSRRRSMLRCRRCEESGSHPGGRCQETRDGQRTTVQASVAVTMILERSEPKGALLQEDKTQQYVLLSITEHHRGQHQN